MGLSFLLHVVNASNIQFKIEREKQDQDVDKSQATLAKEKYWSFTKELLPVVINTWSFTNATERGTLVYTFLEEHVVIHLFCSLEYLNK